MKTLLWVAVLAVAGCVGSIEDTPVRVERATANESDQVLAAAYESRRSDFQVEGGGVVVRVLADDVDGDRHQRFIIQLDSGQTLLIAHNVDLAPRIADLEEGDTVLFNGEYEWNPQGGVLHWTHSDPAGRHPDGWLKHDGSTYQ